MTSARFATLDSNGTLLPNATAASQPDSAVWKHLGNVAYTSEYIGNNVGKPTSAPGILGLCVDTSKQKLNYQLNLKVYKYLGREAKTAGIYMVHGNASHGIQGNPYDPGANWLSVGWFATKMALHLRTEVPWKPDSAASARIIGFGPNTTVDTASVSFTLGASLTGGSEGASGSVNASVGFTFNTEEVRISAITGNGSLDWLIDLPKVGWLGSGLPPQPGRSSYNGFFWTPAVIFEVPLGTVFTLSGKNEIEWEYDYTRGISYYKSGFSQEFNNIVFNDTEVTDYRIGNGDVERLLPNGSLQRYGLEIPAPQNLPYMMQEIERRASTEGNVLSTLLAGVTLTDLLDGLGSTGLRTVFFAPKNEAFVGLIDSNKKLALDLFGPDSKRELRYLLAKLIHNFPAEHLDQVSSALTEIFLDEFEPVPVREGMLMISETFPVIEQLDRLTERIHQLL